MAFSIDENLLMKIRKGTTGEFIIEDLPEKFNSYIARLVIKKEATAKDFNAPINKTVEIANQKIIFKITKNDSDALVIENGEDIGTYKWGVMVEDEIGEFAMNIIPENFNLMPDCIVYPEIAGGN